MEWEITFIVDGYSTSTHKRSANLAYTRDVHRGFTLRRVIFWIRDRRGTDEREADKERRSSLREVQHLLIVWRSFMCSLIFLTLVTWNGECILSGCVSMANQWAKTISHCWAHECMIEETEKSTLGWVHHAVVCLLYVRSSGPLPCIHSSFLASLSHLTFLKCNSRAVQDIKLFVTAIFITPLSIQYMVLCEFSAACIILRTLAHVMSNSLSKIIHLANSRLHTLSFHCLSSKSDGRSGFCKYVE